MEKSNMKMMDCVEVIVEKRSYARDGVHLGMQGWICYSECIDGCWLVNFPQHGFEDDIATVAVKETDLKQVASIDASTNTRIHSQFTA